MVGVRFGFGTGRVARTPALVFHAMGREILVHVDGDVREGGVVAAHVPPWFRSWEARFGDAGPCSEVRRLVHAAGAPFPASYALFDLVQRLEAARARPLLGRLARAVDTPSDPPPVVERLVAKLAPPRASGAGADDLVCDTARRTVTLPAGRVVDLDPYVRAWAADRAASRLGPLRATLVDVGDEVAISGPRAGGGAWGVSVADPSEPDEVIARLHVPAGGLATAWSDACRQHHHGSGVRRAVGPSERARPGALASATVIGPSALEAVVAARAILRLGRDQALAWLDANPPFAGLVVEHDGTAARSKIFGLLSDPAEIATSVA